MEKSISDLLNSFLVKGSSKGFKQYKLPSDVILAKHRSIFDLQEHIYCPRILIRGLYNERFTSNHLATP